MDMSCSNIHNILINIIIIINNFLNEILVQLGLEGSKGDAALKYQQGLD